MNRNPWIKHLTPRTPEKQVTKTENPKSILKTQGAPSRAKSVAINTMNTDYRIPTPTLEPVLPPQTAIKGWNIRQTDEIMKSLRDSQSPTRGNATTLPPPKLHKPKQRRLRRTIPKVDENEATSDVVYQGPTPASTRSKSKRLLSESTNDSPTLRSEPDKRSIKRDKSHISEDNDIEDDGAVDTSNEPSSPQHKDSKENSNQITHDTTRSKSKRHLSESSNETPNLRFKPTGRVTKRGKSYVSEENDYDDDTKDTDDSGTSILPTQTLTSSIDKQQQDKITKSLQQGSEKRLRSISTDNEPYLNSVNNLAKDKYVKKIQL